jgi:hypothetical protein
VSQSLGLRETLYHIDNTDEFSDSISRESLTYSVRTHTRLKRKYSHLTHIIEPEMGYAFISDTNDNPPLLDSTELFNRVSVIEAGIRSYLYDDDGQILSLRLTERYDFHLEDRPFGLIRLEAAVFRPFGFLLDTSFNPNSGEVETINYTASFKILGVDFTVGQRYSEPDDILFYTGRVAFPLTREISLSSAIWYDLKGDGLQDLTVSALYSAQCWGVNVRFNKRPDDYSLFFIVELKGLGAIELGAI